MVANGDLYISIMEKLRFTPAIDESSITVAIKSDGIVILGGKIGSYAEKYLAEKAVEQIEAVQGIANELEVQLTFSDQRDDVDIVKAALNTLKWIFFIPHDRIKVTVEKGHLTLSGEVRDNDQKEKAEEAVENLYGVISITNDIKIIPNLSVKSSSAEVKEKIIKEFKLNTRIDANKILVEVDGGKVTLKGSVKNFDEYKEARISAWSVVGVSSVVDQLEISQ